MINDTSLIRIKELAEFIALEFDIAKTPLEQIIENERIKLIYDSYGANTFDGMTVYTDEIFYIHLNKDNGNKQNSTRGRFTLAHELGHYFIDSHRIGLKRGLLSPHFSLMNQKSYNRIEREADYFASCLLMPETRFKSDIFRKRFSFDLIKELAEKYLVSIIACGIRFTQIGHHPIMIIYGEDAVVKWKIASDDFPFKSLLKDENIPDDTVMGEYFLNNNTYDTGKPEAVEAIDWFKYVRESDTTRVFYEYCLPYKNRAISMIWED